MLSAPARPGASPGRRGGRGRVGLAAALVLGLVLGVAAGVAIARRSGSGGPAASGDPGRSQCPAQRTADGAVTAAVCLSTLLYRLEGRPAELLRTELSGAAANPAAVERLVQLVQQGTPAGGRAAAGVLTVRLGDYRDDGTQAVAQVFVWVASARVADPAAGTSDSASATTAAWSTDAVLLRWTGDRWALAEVERTPTAPPAGARNLGTDWIGVPHGHR